MKKYVSLLLIIFLIFILLMGCAEEKTYKITVRKDSVDISYYAKEIISYTDTSIRFIDKDGNEKFRNGESIRVREDH